MGSKHLGGSFSLAIDAVLYRRLIDHLFPGDDDEHGAVITAGLAETSRGYRLLARDLLTARDGIDYVPGTRGYRALTAKFVAESAGYCANERLCYLSVHCHGGTDSVQFSRDDMASHERGYPALLDITRGGPVGALVLTQNAIAGDIWTKAGRFPLSHASVIGTHVKQLFPSPPVRDYPPSEMFDRHARMFGDQGQAILNDLKVGIIGLGGGGSLINEWMARLGVGHIVAIDPDIIEASNLPRVVGSYPDDVDLRTSKVDIAKRVAIQARPTITFEAVRDSILNQSAASHVLDADFLFLATDTFQSRLVFNALVHQYLIPGVQIGSKVSVSEARVNDAFAVTRPTMPGLACLDCYGLLPPDRLREESLDSAERKRQRYVEDDDIVEPSVITLNALSAAQAANDFLMMFTGMFRRDVHLNHQMNFVRDRSNKSVQLLVPKVECLDCGSTTRSRRARGDRARLPCRAV